MASYNHMQASKDSKEKGLQCCALLAIHKGTV
jgi:hypothetical protein